MRRTPVQAEFGSLKRQHRKKRRGVPRGEERLAEKETLFRIG